MLVGLTYYFVPRITGTPLYSHALSLISFGGCLLYAGVAIITFGAPSRMAANVAVVNSMLILAAVIAFFANIW